MGNLHAHHNPQTIPCAWGHVPGPPRLSPAPSLYPAKAVPSWDKLGAQGGQAASIPGQALATALVLGPTGTSTQHRPRLCLHPQAPASAPRPQGLAQGSTHCPARGWGLWAWVRDPSLQAHGDCWASCWCRGRRRVWAGSTLGTPKQAPPASPGRVDGPRGLPGDGKDPGWSSKPSHPVLKALQLACPVIGPATARPRGPHPATQGVCMCLAAPLCQPAGSG